MFSKCLENVHFRKVSGEISENGRLIFLKKQRWIRRVPVNRHGVGSKKSLKLQEFWDEDLHRRAVGYLEILQVDKHKHCGWLRLPDGHWTTTGGCSPKDGQNKTMQLPTGRCKMVRPSQQLLVGMVRSSCDPGSLHYELVGLVGTAKSSKPQRLKVWLWRFDSQWLETVDRNAPNKLQSKKKCDSRIA